MTKTQALKEVIKAIESGQVEGEIYTQQFSIPFLSMLKKASEKASEKEPKNPLDHLHQVVVRLLGNQRLANTQLAELSRDHLDRLSAPDSFPTFCKHDFQYFLRELERVTNSRAEDAAVLYEELMDDE